METPVPNPDAQPTDVVGNSACVASIIRISYLHTLDGPIDVTCEYLLITT